MPINAGADLSVKARRPVVLQASGASGITWSQVSGPSITFSTGGDGRCAFLSPNLATPSTVVMRASGRSGTALSVPSPGWETGDPFNDWYAGNVTRTIAASYAYSGSLGVRLQFPSGALWGDYMAPATGWAVGQTYTVTARLRPQTLSGTSWGLLATCVTGGGDVITAGTKVSASSTTWAQVTHTFTVPSGTTLVRVGFGIGGTATAAGEIWVDDLEVWPSGSVVETDDVSVAVARAPKVRKPGGTYTPVVTTKPPPVLLPREKSRDNPFTVGGANWVIHQEGVTQGTSSVQQVVNGGDTNRFTLGQSGTASTGAAERIELEGLTTMPHHTDRWFSFWSKVSGLPSVYNTNWVGWAVLFQVHQKPDAGDVEGPQPVGLSVYSDGSIKFVTRHDPNATTTSSSYTSTDRWTQANWPLGVWHRFVIRIRTSKGDSTGWAAIWADGVERFNAQIPLGYNDVRECYPKFGLYRNQSPGQMVHDVARFEMSSSSLADRVASPLPILTR